MKRSLIALLLVALASCLYCQEALEDTEHVILLAVFSLEHQLDREPEHPAINAVKDGYQDYTSVCQKYMTVMAEQPGSSVYYDTVDNKVIVLHEQDGLLLVIVMTSPMFARWVAESNKEDVSNH